LAPTPYPLPESTRQSAVLLGDGSTTYGPFGDGWGIFDVDDVVVETRAVATTVFTEVTDAVIAKVNPAAAYDFFTVTFAAPLTSAFEFRVTGARLHKRELAVTRGGAIDGTSLEKELSKQSVVLQEQRRNIKNTAVMVAGDSASAAVAARILADAAAASAAASAAIFSTALAILVGSAGGTANAPELTHASFAGLVAYPNDMLVVFRITADNTGPMSLAALPLAPKPFVDRSGDAFAGGEWKTGDIAIAEYNLTNNTFRALDRIVDMVLSDKLNIFSALQTFNGNISVASKATFSKQMIYPPVTLVDAVTIAWDLDTGSNFEVTLGGNRTLGAFTNGVNGQKGTLRVIQDGTGGRTLDLSNAVYDFSGNAIASPLLEPISTGANDVTEFEFERIGAASMRLTRKWMSGRNSIGFWKDYDKGALAISTVYPQAHGLGRYPAQVAVFLENTTTEAGWAVGDRILLASGGVNSVATSAGTVGMNATNVYFAMSASQVRANNRNTGAAVDLLTANWKVIMRVYE
jgi:hypothetical protein